VCFARELAPCEIEFVNLLGPRTVSGHTDVLIITYELLALRNTPYWPYLRREIERLTELADVVIFFPQDDYTLSDKLDQLYIDLDADYVFTSITRDLEVLYPQSTKAGCCFEEALTGYVCEDLAAGVAQHIPMLSERSIDVGQRVRSLSPIFGRSAQAKAKLATAFGTLASEQGFHVDISTRPEDVLLGDQWTQFLLSTKFTVGRLGGASVCDPKGKLADRMRRKSAKNSTKTQDEIAQMISWRGARYGDFSAISPRIFEAAALGVCQILVRDHYVNGLSPNHHYLPLEPDLSNASQVFRWMADTSRCQDLVNQSRLLLVDSGTFTYRAFTERFWDTVNVDAQRAQPEVNDAAEALIPFFNLSGSMRDHFKRVIANAVMTRESSVQKDQVHQVINESSTAFNLSYEPLLRSLNEWLIGIQRGEIPIESLLIPWEPAVVAAPDLALSAKE
jgi:hypothetical protein